MQTQYHEFTTLTSTQDWAKEHLSTLDLKKFHIIFSHEQTKGRGRFDRAWHSPKNVNLYVTYCFKIEPIKHSFLPLSLVTGLSIAKTLQKNQIKVKLKWPNDIFIEGKKAGGILVEMLDHHHDKVAIVGFGLNVNMTLDQLKQIHSPATSLLVETHAQHNLVVLMKDIEMEFKHDLKLFIEHGFNHFQKEFEQLSFLKGKKITLEQGHQTIEGMYDHIDTSGAICLTLEDGKTQIFNSGEIKSWE